MAIPIPHFRDRVLACWLGKAVGGTLGLPVEGRPGPLHLTFYNPVPTTMLPNDDLDLQVLWACKLDQMRDRVRVHREDLAQAWLIHVQFPWDEYGVALRNLRAGIQPPFSGSADNWFAHGMGAAIRSEIWACLAAGNPQLAARYAYEDACVDHAGEGIWAEVFLAALQSAAFVESDPHRLLDLAMAQVPSASRIAAVVRDTAEQWFTHHDADATMRHILDHFGHENFTDVVMNIGFTVLGWLAGEGDFDRAICTAVNCGQDTDCTGATVGALMGILDPACIADRWLAPIGRDLVVDARITGITPPPTIDAFADLVCDLHQRLAGQPPEVSPPGPSNAPCTTLPADAWPIADNISDDQPPPAPPDPAILATDGYWHQPDAAFWTARRMAVRYRFTLPHARDVRVMFNTRCAVTVWCDQQRILQSPGQRMGPSFHRTLAGQRADLSLQAGTHELIAVITAPPPGQSGEWVWGLGDPQTHQWLTL